MINIAFVGAGGYAFEVIKRVWQLPQSYNIIAVCEQQGNDSVGLRKCKERNIPAYYDLAEMLKAVAGRVEMIFVPTSIHSHYELAKQCIESGFNVFVEKPPVAVIQDYDDLNFLLERYNRKGAIGFQYLYTDILQRIKSDICSGKYGKIKRVRSFGAWVRYDSYYDNTEWGGKVRFEGKWVLDGSISNPLAHMLASSLYLACDKPLSMAKPVSVQAELYSVHPIEGEDTSSLRIITDEGIEVISNACLCPEEDSEVETIVECEHADIVYTDFCRCEIRAKDGTVEQFNDDSEHRTYMLESIAESLNKGEDFKSDMKNCRAFTLSVNCAYESSQGVNRIDDIYVDKSEYCDTIKRVLVGVDEDIRAAHQQGKLFSEFSLPWTVETEPFNCEGYDFFPESSVTQEMLIKKMMVAKV